MRGTEVPPERMIRMDKKPRGVAFEDLGWDIDEEEWTDAE